MERIFVSILLGALLATAGCGSSNSGVKCVRAISDGGCEIDLVCGTNTCPDGETRQDLSPNAASCVDDAHAGCL